MASLLGTAPNHRFSSFILHRPRPDMPPPVAGPHLPPAEVIEISDDDDESNADLQIFANQAASVYGAHAPISSSTLNARPKPDTSPIIRRDSKRPKLEDAPEASGSQTQYPRAHLDFASNEDGYTQLYPDFFDDAFIPNERDDSSEASTETAIRLLRKAAIRQAKRPPYFFDAKLGIRMYCGPGHDKFPLPVAYDPKFQEACDAFDAHRDDDSDGEMQGNTTLQLLQQECLARVLDIFPDIQRDFVLEKIKAQHELIHFPDEEVEVPPDYTEVIDEILDMESYPKEEANETTEEEFGEHLGRCIRWNQNHRQNLSYRKDAVALLATQFDYVPTHYINLTVQNKGNLFDAYVAIENIESNYFQSTRPYHRSKRPRVQLEKKYQGLNPERDPSYYCDLVVELQAAKQQTLRTKLQSSKQQQLADAEIANLEQHRTAGLLVECKCCFDEEVPVNRTVVCLADEEHHFCYCCVKSLAENQIGMKKYEMLCMDGSGCNKALQTDGIGKAVSIKTFDRLQFNQQQAEIRAANIEGLEQCPFCDFQAICDPIEIDTVFSCQNPECFKVTCRKCHETSHLPKTCEEVKRDRGLSVRHKIEEARTRAMIRTCPSCQSAIVKSDGCNKIRCTCGTAMCYVCKLDLSKLRDAYEHFNKTGSKCPLYDVKSIDRHAQEANAAEEQAIQEARAEDDTIDEGILRIETGKGKEKEKERAVPTLDHLQGLGADLNELRQRQRQIEAALNPVRDRAARRRRRDDFQLNGRHFRWLQGVREYMPPPPPPPPPPLVPELPVHNPPQAVQPLQAGRGNDMFLCQPLGHVLPNQHAQAQQTQQPIQADQYPFREPALVPAPLNVGKPKANDYPLFNCAPQQPRPDNADIFNADYVNTAQRIHEARDQQAQRRRSQIERRSTMDNGLLPQLPNPDFLNVRNNNLPFQNLGSASNFGTQPPNQNHLLNAYPNPIANNAPFAGNRFENPFQFPGFHGDLMDLDEPMQQNVVMPPAPRPFQNQAQMPAPNIARRPTPLERAWRSQFRPPTPRGAGDALGPDRGGLNRRQTTSD